MKRVGEESTLEIVEKYGKVHTGRTEYITYLKGGHVSAAGLIKAKCYECMGYYADGAKDCKISLCPLYPYMPYQKTIIRKKRVMSDKQKDVLCNARVKRIPKGLQK